MRCLFYSYCDEPKYLCCNFCSNKNCWKRCTDDHTKCKFHEVGEVVIDTDKPNHIIKKKLKINAPKVASSKNEPNTPKACGEPECHTPEKPHYKSNSTSDSCGSSQKVEVKTKCKKQKTESTIGEAVVLF